MDPVVGVVVLNWNGYFDTARCLKTLLQTEYGASLPVVVDNASVDGSFERLREEFPSVEFIRAERNLGYAGGNNLGIRWALERGARYVYVINNDTEVPPDSIGKLVATIESDPRIGQVGPLVQDATCDRIGAVGGSIYWPTVEPRQIGHLEEDHGQYAAVIDVDFVPGTAVLARSDAIAQVGVLPEHYFIYFEDVDWSLRFQQAGWRTVADPRAAIVHYESATMGQHSPIKLYYYVRNNLLFLDAWVAESQRRAARTRLNVKFAKQAVKSVLRRSVPHLRALAGAFADYRTGRTGKTERRL